MFKYEEEGEFGKSIGEHNNIEKRGRPRGSLGSQKRKENKQTTRKLIRWEKFVIQDLKQELRFTEEYLYEAVRLYRKDKDMPALMVVLKQIVKARG